MQLEDIFQSPPGDGFPWLGQGFCPLCPLISGANSLWCGYIRGSFSFHFSPQYFYYKFSKSPVPLVFLISSPAVPHFVKLYVHLLSLFLVLGVVFYRPTFSLSNPFVLATFSSPCPVW